MAPHSSTLAWKISWTEEPGRLQTMGSRLHFHFSLSCIGEGNGNPLQCSCLENPRDGGAWWAAVYGVSQSRTRAAAAKSLQSCPTLCDPIDGSPPGSPSLGFSRQEDWSGLPFPSPMHESENESEVAQSCPTFMTPWTAAYQAPPSMGFARQEYWSGVPLPSLHSLLLLLLLLLNRISFVRLCAPP